MKTIKEQIRYIFLNAFVSGMEAVNCDECGDKGTGQSFDKWFDKNKSEIETILEQINEENN